MENSTTATRAGMERPDGSAPLSASGAAFFASSRDVGRCDLSAARHFESTPLAAPPQPLGNLPAASLRLAAPLRSSYADAMKYPPPAGAAAASSGSVAAWNACVALLNSTPPPPELLLSTPYPVNFSLVPLTSRSRRRDGSPRPVPPSRAHACSECRSRKIRCDGSSPCGECARSETAICSLATTTRQELLEGYRALLEGTQRMGQEVELQIRRGGVQKRKRGGSARRGGR
jgi:hypothetical protein